MAKIPRTLIDVTFIHRLTESNPCLSPIQWHLEDIFICAPVFLLNSFETPITQMQLLFVNLHNPAIIWNAAIATVSELYSMTATKPIVPFVPRDNIEIKHSSSETCLPCLIRNIRSKVLTDVEFVRRKQTLVSYLKCDARGTMALRDGYKPTLPNSTYF